MFSHLEDSNLRDCVIIMGNVPFHKTQIVSQKFRENGHRLIFLPPYSLFLNPIENMVSKWKGLVRRSAPQSEDQLLNSMSKTLNDLNDSDCQGFSRLMLRNLVKCLERELFNK